MKITFMTYEEHNNDDISELGLPDAIERFMKKNGMFYVGDLIDKIESGTFSSIRNMGAVKEKKIKNALFNYELCVAPDPIEFLFKCERIA